MNSLLSEGVITGREEAQKQENQFLDLSPYSLKLGLLSFSCNHGNRQRMLVLKTRLQLAEKTTSSHKDVFPCQPHKQCCAVTVKVENPRKVFGWCGERSLCSLNILKQQYEAVSGLKWSDMNITILHFRTAKMVLSQPHSEGT